MDNTRAQQKALDDELVAPANPFEISADVPEIYMQELWVTVSRHHSSLRFKLNGKSHTVNVDNFRDMLKICPKLSGQIEEPPLEEAILSFIRDLGYTDYFMAKDQAIPKRNKMFWHYVRDDFMFTTIRVISKHQETQIPKPKYVKNKVDSESSPTKKTATIAKGKRLKSSAKAAKPAKKKQLAKTSKAKGLTVLFEVALTEAEQRKIATKRSLIQTHSFYGSGSGADKGTSGKPGVPNVLTYGSDDEQISWKSSEEEDDDEVDMNEDDDENDDNDDNDEDDDDNDDDDAANQDNDGQEYDEQDDENEDDDNEQTDSENDGDDFVHPKFSTHDEEDKEEDSFDPRVQTPYHIEFTDDEDSDEEIQSANVERDEQDEDDTNEEVKANELYRDVNINMIGRDTEMINAPRTIIQTTQVIKDTHVIITPVNPEDVPVTTIVEPPLLSVTTLPQPPTPLITHLQQTPVPTPETVPSSSLQDLPNFGSLFGEEAQDENENFINTLDDNIKKIIKEQIKEQVKAQVSKILPKIEKTINEQLEAEVLTRSSNESKTSHVVATNLSKLELKKILIDKMESNKSIHGSNEQKNLYKALVDAYESDKLILITYGYTLSFKRCRDDEDKDKEPSARSNRGSKRRRAGKESESTSAPKEKTSKTTSKSIEGSKSHHNSADKSAQTSQLLDWFQKPAKPPTPDHDWNKTLPAAHGPVQPWLSTLAQREDTRESFNELMDTPLDFSAFMINRLKVDTLTPELLAGPIFELMKGSCKSLVELEYFFEEVYKATTNQLDWNNPEGHKYPHDLRKPLPLIPNSRGHRVIPFDHLINKDLEYLSECGVKCRLATTNMHSEESHIGGENDNNSMDLLLTGNLLEMSTLNTESLLIVIQRRVEDLQLSVESYQKKLNLTKPDTYRPDLKRREAYTAYSNPIGFIYQNKDKKNRLMCIDELHKFSDGTLNDVRLLLMID
ncbi:hypothetical protein Tco_0801348 [Tanacetum coccineum]|uniref:Uncharacterized protein n=1 Tax=Tanacetum coccineum TaxID=301880 RepID=A0ABQ4ZVQ5_9ASTR